MLRAVLQFILLFTTIFAQAETFQVISYHDVVSIEGKPAASDDIGVRHLADHFEWLQANGYNVISVQDLVDARNGVRKLPPKAVLLTFDDGYSSFYKLVFPLLRAYKYPATLAIVGSWMEQREKVMYGARQVERQRFLTLEQLKEIAASGLVEIASHSYDLHHGIPGNPQGNEMPAATTRAYDAVNGSYEGDVAHETRIRRDLARNSDFIETYTGKRPRVMVWPYGRYNGEVQRIAGELGMFVTMNMDDGDNVLDNGLTGIHRYYLKNDTSAAELALTLGTENKLAMRVMHVDLDYIYDPDPQQQEKNLGLLLDRIKAAGVTAVFLQAFADDNASGVANRLYFPNRHLPVKADLFNRVSWQIATRTGSRVFAWLPLTAFVPPSDHPLHSHKVIAADGSTGVGYARLSPFSAEVREYVAEIYEDLGRYAYFEGLLIHDDAVLSDQEDDSVFAHNYYTKRLGLPAEVSAIRENPEMMQKWTKAKTEHLSWFTEELRRRVEIFRKPLMLARNYYAEPMLNPQAEAWFSQSLPDALRHYDWVAVMAMPYMEKASDANAWLDRLIHAVRNEKGAEEKVIFELQAKRWAPDMSVPSEEIASWMRRLRVAGIRHFGYYPDDPFANHPDITTIKRELSVQRYAQ